MLTVDYASEEVEVLLDDEVEEVFFIGF